MRRLAYLVLATFALLTSAAPALAQSGQATCHSNDRHFVASVSSDEAVWETFAITHKSAPDEIFPCSVHPEIADLVIEGEYAFEALEGDYLVLSEGTSSMRTLRVFELKKGKVILSSEAELDGVRSDGLTYWERREMGTEDNCAQYAEYTGYGGGGIISHELRFDFATRNSQATEETRCDYME